MTNLGNQKAAILECCTCGCNGCCVPTNEDGSLADIPWEISAPGCPEIDGATGTFTPVDATVDTGPCGHCATYLNVSSPVSITGQQASGVVDPFGECTYTPCTIGELCFALECLRSQDGAAGLSDCCSRLFLWVGTDRTLEGDDGSRPRGGVASLCLSWRRVSASTCTCEGGLSAEFPIELVLYCTEFWEAPNICAPEPKCCQIECDLSGAKLVI